MRVRVVEAIETVKGTVMPGQIIDIPDALFDKLEKKVEPVKKAFAGSVEIVTKEGVSFWIATEPEAAELIPEGAISFLPDEIEHLHQAGREAARLALEIKRNFSQAKVRTCRKKGGP